MSINQLKKKISHYFDKIDFNKSLIIIAGPTGIGKSKFAVKLAKEINGIIINSDSMQVYKNLKIISSQPTFEDMKGIKHFLYGFKDINEDFSVGTWLELVSKVLNYKEVKNKIPILVGGTGLYLNVIHNGLAPIPKIDEKIKNNTNNLLHKIGISEFRERVKRIDPIFFSTNNDKQRLIRAYNVYQATGKNLSQWHKSKPKKIIKRKIYSILLNAEKIKIYNICDNRFDRFLKEGGLDEVRKIWEQNINRSSTGAKALGVRWLLEFYDGRISLNNAIDLSKRDTRRYVKRQNTWFKNNFDKNIKIEV